MGNTVELADPESGHSVILVGTAHVSAKAAEDVKEILEEVRPQLCAVELDRVRMKHALARLRRLQGGYENSHQHQTPDTSWKVLKLMYSKDGGPQRLFYILSDSFSSSVLGVPYGVDMLAAISTATKLGIPVVPIDRPSQITIARFMAQGNMKNARKQFEEQQKELMGLDPESDQDLGKLSPMERRKAAMRRMRGSVLSLAQAAGCPDAEKTVESFVSVMHQAMSDHEVVPEDLEAVRGCGAKVVEYFRNMAASGAAERPGDDIEKGSSWGRKGEGGASDTPEGAPPPPALRRMLRMMLDGEGPPALTKERDLILAQNLRLCSARGPTVAVVGAAHVPGIQRRWPEALSPQALAEAKAYFQLPTGRPAPPFATPGTPADSPDSSLNGKVLEDFYAGSADGKELQWYAPSEPYGGRVWRVPLGPIVATAGYGALCYYRPRAAAVLGASLVTMAAAGNWMIASTIANVGKAAVRMEEASRKIAIEKEDSGLF